MKTNLRHLWLIYAILLVLTACSSQESIIIDQAWARPGDAGQNSAVYFMIENRTSRPIQITDASSEIARHVEIHLSSMQNGVMRMEKQESVEIDSKQKMEFKPGDYHIMLMNLNENLSPGDVFSVTLTLDQEEPIIIEAIVKEP